MSLDSTETDLSALPLLAGPWDVSPEHDLAARPLGSGVLVLNLSDLWRLAALGPGFRWTTGDSGRRRVPVVIHRDHGRLMVARLIAGATPVQEVAYRDGDPFNATRGNLVVREALRRHRRGSPEPVLVQVNAMPARPNARGPATPPQP